MKAVIVYESMFGNTREVAFAIARGLESAFTVQVMEVSEAVGEPHPPADLLVVGGPTHAFGMSRASTRQSAAQQASGALVSPGDGIREWLARQSPARPHACAATFDTHAYRPRWLPGSAARPAGRRLRRLGYRLVARPQNFYVDGTLGPLVAGELERAQSWGERLIGAVKASVS